jgi:multicomponent Na+:H+ antiporter subunit D
MVAATAGMVTVTVALTVLAGPLYGVAESAARDLFDRGPYIEAVLDADTP